MTQPFCLWIYNYYIELFNYIFVFDDIALVIVKDNSFSAVLLESKSATRKACGAVLFFIGEAGTRADDDGAGLTLVVGGAALIVDIGVMLVSAEHKIGLYFLAEKASPLRVGVLLDIKGRLVGIGKYKVANDELMLNAFSLVFVLCVLYYAFYKLGFGKAELMEAYCYAVFGMTVYFILAAVENESPDGSYAEGIVGLFVNGGNELRHILCVNTAGVVISSCENNGAGATRNSRGYFVDSVEILDISAVVGNISVKNQKVDIIAKVATCGNRLFNEVVSVCYVLDVDISIGGNRTEGEGYRTLLLAYREIWTAVYHFNVVNGVFLCRVKH